MSYQVFWNDCSKNLTTSLTLCHESPDGEGGFPGTVRAKVKYTLNAENELRIQFDAKTNKATPINMANHAYFNLAGHVSIRNNNKLLMVWRCSAARSFDVQIKHFNLFQF